MGHRQYFNTSQMFDGEDDQNWNHMHAEQPYLHLARIGPTENGSFFHPEETMSMDAVHASHWNPAPRSNGYTSSHVEVPHFQPDVSGQSHDSLFHLSNHGTFWQASENYAHHASSSNYERQTFQGTEGNAVDLTMGSGRGHHKRKSPGVPPICERGSSSRYYSAGSSSELPTSSELGQEKPNMESPHMPWDHINMGPSYRGKGTLSAEGSMRNVRSRSAFDLESNLSRTHLSSNPPINFYANGHPFDHSSAVDLSGQSSSAWTREWSNSSIPTAHGRMDVSDTSSFSRETNHFLVGSSGMNAATEIGGYHHDLIPSRNPVPPQSFHGNLTQSVGGVRSNFSQRSTPAFRASSSNLRLGPVAPSNEGLQLNAESYSSRHPRPLSTLGWRNSGRNGRSRVYNDRYRSPDEATVHDRLASEGFMMVDRSGFYGSRNMFDQHRDMRLDVDSMSYEELLALGERIGSVSTGVSEDLIPKCLTETILSSLNQLQEEGTCVICLEEYKNMDAIGKLKTCGHDYHVSCIKKWLSMKNSCPICKSSALSDNTKGK